MLLKLARLSLWNRRSTAVLTLISLSLSVALLLGIDHLRSQAQSSFRQTLSGTDLIVGPRGGQTNLLLYSVFQMGQPSNSLSPEAFDYLAGHPMVDWALPLALGDSLRGFPVFATQPAYFEHYRYGQRRSLELSQGRSFKADNEVVLGDRAARKLGYGLGDEIILSHGVSGVSFNPHDDHPMQVVGVLAPTGTPVDRRVHISLEGMAALHDRGHGESQHSEGHAQEQGQSHDHGHDPGERHSHEPDDSRERNHSHERDRSHERDHSQVQGQASAADVLPGPVNAVFLGLKSRAAVFSLQREINEARIEPMTALIPGVALTQLWQLLGVAENLLLLISFLVLLATLTGMMTMLLASMGERRRELAILRTLGATSGNVVWLVELEVLLLTGLGLIFGLLLLSLGLALTQPWLATEFGLFIAVNPVSPRTLSLILGIVILALVMGLIPARAAYRRSLADGLVPKA